MIFSPLMASEGDLETSKDANRRKSMSKELSLDKDCVEEVFYSQFRRFLKDPPLGFYCYVVRNMDPQIYIINISGIDILLMVYLSHFYNVYVQSILGTKLYSFSSSHLDSTYGVFDALRLAYNSYLTDLIPSQASIDLRNNVALDQILIGKNHNKKMGFFEKTFKRMKIEMRKKKISDIFSISAQSTSTISTALSFKDLQKEFSDILEVLKGERGKLDFKEKTHHFKQILHKNFMDIEQNLRENQISIVVLLDNKSDDLIDKLQYCTQEGTTSIFGTGLETQNFHFLAKTDFKPDTDLTIPRKPSESKLLRCLLEFIQTQLNYQEKLEDFYEIVIQKAKKIKNINLNKTCNDFEKVIRSERVVLHFILHIFNLEKNENVEKASRHLIIEEGKYLSALLGIKNEQEEHESSNFHEVAVKYSSQVLISPNHGISEKESSSIGVSTQSNRDYNLIPLQCVDIRQLDKEPVVNNADIKQPFNDISVSFSEHERKDLGRILQALHKTYINPTDQLHLGKKNSLKEILNEQCQNGEHETRIDLFFQFFNIYIDKMNCYKNFMMLYSTYNIKDELDQNEISIRAFNNDLSNIFILPIQRLIRYKQFLEKFYQFGSENMDFPFFKSTILRLANYIKMVDRERFAFESGRKAFEIQSKIEKCPHSILNVRRAFKNQIHGSISATINISIFLYNDILMFAISNKITTNIFKNEGAKYQFLKIIPIKNAQIIQISENQLKFIISEKETEVQPVHIPGSRITQAGEDIFSIFIFHTNSQFLREFLGDFYFHKNNDFSLKWNSRMFVSEQGGMFLYFHLIQYDENIRSRQFCNVLNLSERQISVDQTKASTQPISQSISTFLSRNDQIIWTVRVETPLSASNYETNGTRHFVKFDIQSSKKVKFAQLTMDIKQFQALFRKMLCDSVLIHSSIFPLSKQLCSVLKCNMSVLENIHKKKIDFDCFNPVYLGISTIAMIFQLSRDIEKNFTHLFEQKTNFNQRVQEMIGEKMFYRPLENKCLTKFIKSRRISSKEDLETLRRKTDTMATFFRYFIYEMFTFEQIEHISNEIQSDIYSKLEFKNDRFLYFNVFFRHFKRMTQLISSSIFIHLIKFLIFNNNVMDDRKLNKWLNLIFADLGTEV